MRLAVLAVGVLVLAAAAYHVAALTAYEASADPGPLAARLEHARVAACMEPWQARFTWRVIAIEGLDLLAAGRTDDAYRLLEPYSRIVRGDGVYRAAYQEAVRLKTPLDARKAHVQHSREQAGGYLREQDVIR